MCEAARTSIEERWHYDTTLIVTEELSRELLSNSWRADFDFSVGPEHGETFLLNADDLRINSAPASRCFQPERLLLAQLLSQKVFGRSHIY